ncbi:MAG: permease [Actinobacteria bacterium]|nr:permease [Actinomycetota bacterium]
MLLYINTESSIPLIKALMAGGAGGGAMLAFMITGQGTSARVIAGIATFMKKRVLSLYILFILVGGIFMGYVYDLFLMMGI